MFSLIKKLLDIRWKEYKLSNIKFHRTYEINKISLSCFDDKRFVLDDGVHTLPYFHKDCNKKCYQNENENGNNHDNEKWEW